MWSSMSILFDFTKKLETEMYTVAITSLNQTLLHP